jgi:hypothetical protein
VMHNNQPVNLPAGKIANDIPAINTQPVNKRPVNNTNQFQMRNQKNVPMHNQPQPQNQKRNVRMQNARPVQRVESMPKQPKPIKERGIDNN